MYRLQAQYITDPHNQELTILVVGNQHSIWNLWYVLKETQKYKIEVIDLDSLVVIDPKKGIPLTF